MRTLMRVLGWALIGVGALLALVLIPSGGWWVGLLLIALGAVNLLHPAARRPAPTTRVAGPTTGHAVAGTSRRPSQEPADRTLTNDEWAYALGASGYQDAIGRRERDVTAELRLLRNRRDPSVTVYISGKKVGQLNARAAKRIADLIKDRSPDTLAIYVPGRVVAMDGDRLYGVQVRYPE